MLFLWSQHINLIAQVGGLFREFILPVASLVPRSYTLLPVCYRQSLSEPGELPNDALYS